MKSTLRHYAPVALLLAVILVAASCLSLVTGRRAREDRPLVLATTYPLYLAAQNVLGDSDAVRLEMLSGVGTGCLHDYQLTPADRLALAEADLVLCNGVGSEPFLDGIVEESRRVDTGAGVELLCAEPHHHEGEAHHHETTAYNEHLWLSPARYIQQVGAVSNALIRLDVQGAPTYAANQAAYSGAIHDEILLKLPDLSGRPCVLFHDSLAYLAADLGLEVELVLTADGDSGIAAEDLAVVERLAREHPDLLLIYDTQYPIRYSAVDGLVPPGQVLSLESAVVGAGTPTDWLDAMTRNLEKLQSLGGDVP